ncbi:MAG: hypothetical protein M1829_005974 [Trizodia sp. TS-e1964]|nr:MAG: hypothetical protein M1829_005974 [Trizodia sp. TS-e1964]
MIASSTVSVVLMSGLALANVLPRSAPVQIQLTTDYGCITQADLGKGRPNVDTTKIFCANGYPLGWPNSLEKTFNKPFTLYTEADESFGFCVNADELPKCQLDVCLGNIPKGTTQLNYQAKERCLFDQNG